MEKRCKPLLICPEDLEEASQSDCDYYYTLCQICGHVLDMELDLITSI